MHKTDEISSAPQNSRPKRKPRPIVSPLLREYITASLATAPELESLLTLRLIGCSVALTTPNAMLFVFPRLGAAVCYTYASHSICDFKDKDKDR